MANRTLKVQILTAGSTTGPFSIYHTSISAPNLLVTGVTRQQLVDGYYIEVNTLYNVLHIKSTGKCSTEDSFVYSIVPTPAPTPEPTAAPTASPTAAPVTPAPTPSPTASPTAAPVLPPSTSPTPAPTPEPTASPTAAPVTPAPTPSPTASPTAAPVTPAPTPSPTAAPVTPAPVTPAPIYQYPAPTVAAQLHVLQGGYMGGQVYYTNSQGQYLSVYVYAYQNVTICARIGSINQSYGSITWYSYGVTCYN